MSVDEELRAIIRRRAAELFRKSAVERVRCPRGPIHADRGSFYSLLRRCGVVLVDFWAEWCGPCRLVEPIVEALAERYAGRVAVLKVNVDEDPSLAMEYGVASIPTLILFHRGREYRRFVGFNPFLGRQIASEIDGLLARG